MGSKSGDPGQVSTDLDEIRHQLLVLARRRRAHRTEWSKGMPTVWCPSQVVNPKCGEVFTEAAAWDYVASRLEAGEPLKEVPLEHPPGKKAFEMDIDLGQGGQRLYVKLQLGNGTIIGRSFHYSKKTPSRGERRGGA